MSEFRVDVVPIHLERHANADTLSIVHAGGFQAVVRTQDWSEGQLAAYIPPDSVVPDTEAYAFLKGHRRIRAVRLRGEWSMGLLVPAPSGACAGDDVAEMLGVTHYEPPIKNFNGTAFVGGEAETPPHGFKPDYDMENGRRFTTVFTPGEEVIATEKIHGANGRWTFQDGRFYAGSHHEWKQPDVLPTYIPNLLGLADGFRWPSAPTNLWWRALFASPSLQAFLLHHPGMTVYGEIYGWVQDLHYGKEKGDLAIAAFDLWHEPHADCACRSVPMIGWLDYDAATSLLRPFLVDNLQLVPEVYRGPFHFDTMVELTYGKSLIAGAAHIREGVVVRPVVERQHAKTGRALLKFISAEYLAKVA